MATIQKNLNVRQGYNFKKDIQSTVGFITALKIGDKEVKADQTVKDPSNPENDLKVVAVLSGAAWQTGNTDSVLLEGQISINNKQEISMLVLKEMTKVDVSFQFLCYEYDPHSKQYFKSFHSNDTAMNGLLEKEGSELSMSVSDYPSTEVQSPENYTFHIGIKPQPTAQNLHLATAVDKKVAMSWGLTVDA